MMSKLKSVDVVQCDSSHSCPESSTCCKLADGSWGCCPVRDGTCCEDHIHCCAKGLTCDTAQGRCISETGTPVDKSYVLCRRVSFTSAGRNCYVYFPKIRINIRCIFYVELKSLLLVFRCAVQIIIFISLATHNTSSSKIY